MEQANNTRRIDWTWPIVLIATCLFLTAVFLPNAVNIRLKARDAEAKQNLHAIQLAVERYGVDHDERYPPTLQAARDAGYLPELPGNPYWRPATNSSPRGLMVELPLGSHAPAGVTYVPHYGQLRSGKTGLVGYTLLVYGDELARRAHRTLRVPDTRRGLSPAQTASVPWDYVLLALHQIEGKGDVPYKPLPEPAGQ